MPYLKTRLSEPTPRKDQFRWLYQSAQWHKFSKNYLKANRLCKHCLEKGKTTIAKVVDHITKLTIWFAQGGNPYDLTNLQPLCKGCHSIKTREECTS